MSYKPRQHPGDNPPYKLGVELREPTIKEMLENGLPESCFMRYDTPEEIAIREAQRITSHMLRGSIN